MTRAVLVTPRTDARGEVAEGEISSALRELVAEAMIFHHATARAHGLTFLQLLLLRSIETKGPMAPSQVAALFGISRPAVTASLNVLEEGGWIVREHRPGDRRRLQTTLRPSALQLLRRIDHDRRRLLEEGLATIPRSDRVAYLRITRRLIEGLRSRVLPDGGGIRA